MANKNIVFKSFIIFCYILTTILLLENADATENDTLTLIREVEIEGIELQSEFISAQIRSGNHSEVSEDMVLTVLHDDKTLDIMNYSRKMSWDNSSDIISDLDIRSIVFSMEKAAVEIRGGADSRGEDHDYDICVEPDEESIPVCDDTGFKILSDDIHRDRIFFGFDIGSEDEDFNITYSVYDLEGNLVKDPFTTDNLNEKQFTPKVDDAYEIFVIDAILNMTGCNDTYHDNSYVIFNASDDKGRQEEQENTEVPDLSIEHVYKENHLEFGSEVEVKLRMKNLDSVSDSVIYITDEEGNLISDEKNFGFFRGSEALFTQELMLMDDCTRAVNAELILESFGMTDSYDIFIECDDTVNSGVEENSSSNLSAPEVDSSDDAQVGPGILSSKDGKTVLSLFDNSLYFSEGMRPYPRDQDSLVLKGQEDILTPFSAVDKIPSFAMLSLFAVTIFSFFFDDWF